MITELILKPSLISKSKYAYINDLPLLKENMYFNEGLNVIFAPNGSGKTTLLEILAKATHSREWGYSCVTRKSLQNEDFLRAITDEERNAMSRYIPPFSLEALFEVKHDGQPVAFCDPRYIVGGFNSDDSHHFGYEYMEAHKHEHINMKGSTGNKNKYRMSLINDILEGVKSLEKVEKKGLSHAADCNDLSDLRRGSSHEVNYNMLNASIEEGQKTILIDEPESALDLKEKLKWFRGLEEKVKNQNLQVILITHSELALTFKNAHFISVNDNYINEVRNELKSFFN